MQALPATASQGRWAAGFRLRSSIGWCEVNFAPAFRNSNNGARTLIHQGNAGDTTSCMISQKTSAVCKFAPPGRLLFIMNATATPFREVEPHEVFDTVASVRALRREPGARFDVRQAIPVIRAERQRPTRTLTAAKGMVFIVDAYPGLAEF